jgi:hypothetical protein
MIFEKVKFFFEKRAKKMKNNIFSPFFAEKFLSLFEKYLFYAIIFFV